MKRALLLVSAAAACSAGAVTAQSTDKDKADVQAVVARMFDGMREADSTKVRSVMDAGARFAGVRTRARMITSSVGAKRCGKFASTVKRRTVRP